MARIKMKKKAKSPEKRAARMAKRVEADRKAEASIKNITDGPAPKSPHDLVFAFQEAYGVIEDRGTEHQLRKYLEEEFAKCFGHDPDPEVSNSTLKGCVGYFYQIQGYKEAGIPIPPKVQERADQFKKKEEDDVMKKARTTEKAKATKATGTAKAKGAAKEKKKRPRGAATVLRELVMENRKEKRTDEQIFAIVNKQFPGRYRISDVQWMRGDLIRRATDSKHKNAGSVPFSTADIEKNALRFDKDGKDITGQRRHGKAPKQAAKKAVKKATKKEAPKAKKAAVKKATKAAKPAAKRAALKPAAKKATKASKKARVK